MLNINKKNQGFIDWPAQALMETAILLPILLLLILGAMDFGRLFYTKTVMTNAAREGASYLARNKTCKLYADMTTCRTNTLSVIRESGVSSGVSIIDSDVAWAENGCSKSGTFYCVNGDPATITITKNIPLFYGGFLKWFGVVQNSQIQISSSVDMVIQ
jgi:hypothetical protein